MKRTMTYWLALLAVILVPLCLNGQTVLMEETFDDVTKGSNTGNPRMLMDRYKGNDNILNPKTVYQADKAIYVGSPSNSQIGYFTLAPLDLSANAGTFDVTVRLKGGNTDGSGKLKVSILDNEASAQEYLPTKYRGDEWETYTYSFAGGAKGTVVRFETVNNPNANNCKSVYIDNIIVSQQTGEPTIASETTLVNFRRVDIGMSALRQVEVVGANLPSEIFPEVMGTDTDVFVIKSSETTGDKTTVRIEFTPTKPIQYEATLQLSSGSAFLDISLSGIGVDPSNPYGFDLNATPINELNEPFTEDPLLTTWREVAFEGAVHWERKLPYDAEPVMVIDATDSGQKVRSALITPLVSVPSGLYTTILSADYRIGNVKGGKVVIKRFGKDGKLIADLETISPTEPVEGQISKVKPLIIKIPSDGKASFFVFEYIADDSAADEAQRTTLTFLLDNVKLSSEAIPEPVINTDLDKLDFGEVELNTSSTKAIEITGEHIVSRITIEVVGRDKDYFDLDKLSIPAMGDVIQVTLKGAKETSLEAKLVLKGNGSGEGMIATKEIPIIGKLITSVDEVLSASDVVRVIADGILLLRDAKVALYTADGQLLIEGSYRAGDKVKTDYVGSVIAYVDGAVYKMILR